MRSILKISYLIIAIILVAACSKKNSDIEAGTEYSVSGVLLYDSIMPENLHLFINKHTSFKSVVLPVDDGRFFFTGKTEDIDELYLMDDSLFSVNLFATPDAKIEIIVNNDGNVSVRQDSLNIRISNLICQIDTLKEQNIKTLFDSVSKVEGDDAIVSLLFFRERMHLLRDSLFLRQCIGRLNPDAQPAWLIKEIEQNFNRPGLRLRRNTRLASLPKLRTDVDSVFFDFKETRQNSTYIYFWAEYSQESVDSLQMLVPIAEQYGLHEYIDSFKPQNASHRPKRIDVVTICLNSNDSASWLSTVKDLPGYHILLQDGFSNPNIKSWNINRVPYNLLIDRFSNIQDSYQWGKGLHDALERMPNNFSYNGSKNNLSRTTRH